MVLRLKLTRCPETVSTKNHKNHVFMLLLFPYRDINGVKTIGLYDTSLKLCSPSGKQLLSSQYKIMATSAAISKASYRVSLNLFYPVANHFLSHNL